MGLSGRKQKQRIGEDPRNLSWADNAAKFGATYLAKFGWDSSKGLGASGDGRLSHIKVSQKLDMLGIGAAHQKDPNGIAWKQNRDFENLLKRLNGDDNAGETSNELRQLFHKEDAAPKEETSSEVVQVEVESTDKKKRKRKDKDDDDKQERKRRKKEAKAAAKVPPESESSSPAPSSKNEQPSTTEPSRKVLPRHRSHRARAMAAKNIASKSSAAISEILGISPSATPPVVETPTPDEGTLTTLDEHPAMEKLTISSKSVSDYFKERLLAKSSSSAQPSGPSTSASSDEAEEEVPRSGLGSSRPNLSTFGSSSSSAGLGLSSFASASKFAMLMGGASLTPAVDAASVSCTSVVEDVARGEHKKKRKTESKSVREERTSPGEDDRAADRRSKKERKVAKDITKNEASEEAMITSTDKDPEVAEGLAKKERKAARKAAKALKAKTISAESLGQDST